MTRIAFAAPAALLALTAACGAKRTTAASQPTPAAFDATKSDPKALATVDAALAALGGYDKWQATKELHFEIKYSSGGKLAAWQKQTWDRWNGRHHFMNADPGSLAGDPSKAHWLEVKYDLFDQAKIPYAAVDGQQLEDDDAKKNAKIAREQLNNAYLLMIAYRLRDPGVHLAAGDEIKNIQDHADLCQPSCLPVTVTYDPSVGTDTWKVDFNTSTHLPEIIEKVLPQGSIAFHVEGWSDASGLKFPSKMTNIGLPTEFFGVENVTVGDVHDSEYEVPVDRSNGASAGMTDHSH